MYIYYNPNPLNKSTGDCVIRALAKALNTTWYDIFLELMALAFEQCDMPSSNYIWNEYLLRNGFKCYMLTDACPYCYTVSQFAEDHPYGIYILGTGLHAVTIKDGNYYDAWDSGNEVPIYYFEKE